MTSKERCFLISFLEKIDKNDYLIKIEDEILTFLSELENQEKNQQNKTIEKINDIQEKFYLYSELVKYQFFNYGLLANHIEKTFKLNYVPDNLKELVDLEEY